MNSIKIELDPYEVLNVDYNTTLKDLRKSFRKLILLAHPDRGGDPIKFNIIKQAYSYIFHDLKKQDELYNKEQETIKTRNHTRNRQDMELNNNNNNNNNSNNNIAIDPKKFNVKTFNNLFHNYRVEESHDHGYGDVMSNRNNVRENSDSMNKVQKFENRNLVIYNEPKMMTSTDNVYNLGQEQVDDYTKGFNINDKGKKIHYTDYVRAHSECEKMTENVPNVRRSQFNSVDELNRDRKNITYTMSREDTIKLEIENKKILEKEKKRLLNLRNYDQNLTDNYQRFQSLIRYK